MGDRVRPTTRQVRRRALHRLDDAIEALDLVGDADAAVAADATHRVRTSCKEARALLRLLEPAESGARRRVDALVDEAGASLGTMRDEQVLAETLKSLPAPVDTPARTGAPPDGRDIGNAGALLRAARDQVADWHVGSRHGPILGGLTDAYRVARRRLHALQDDPTDELLHDWRRAVKRLTYEVRAVRRWAPSMLRPYAAALDDLGSLLGEDHDLANAVLHLERSGSDDGSAEASAIQAARARRRVLLDRATGLGSELFAERPAAFRARMRAYGRHRPD